MNTDSGRIGFSIEIDTAGIEQGTRRAENAFNDLGNKVRQECSYIDAAMASSGDGAKDAAEKAKSAFTILEEAVLAAGKQINGLEFQTTEEKIGSLSYAIQQNEEVMAEGAKMLEKWKKDALDAFKAGDESTMHVINADIDEQIQKLKQLADETNNYRETLDLIKGAAGMQRASGSNAPQLFNSEKDIQALQDLRKEILNTKAEIQRVGADGGNTAQLTAELSEMQGRLNDAETAATAAAAALGSDLGGRAAEAQMQLFAINKEMAEQQNTIDTLNTKLQEASAAYNEAKNSTTATADEVSRAAAAHDDLARSLADAKMRMDELRGAQADAQSAWNGVNDEIRTHDSVLVKMLGGYDNYKRILGQLPMPMQSVVGGIQGMTGAARAFIATPLGAVLAAIVLALQAVKTWLNSSIEGQMELAKVTGYLGGVLDQLKEIVISVGKALYKAFTEPKQALQDLWDTITNNPLEKLSNWFKGVHDAASENSSISVELRQLEIEVSEWGKRYQELEAIKAKARGRMMNRSLSTEEMKKEKKLFEDALEEQYKTEAKFADKRIELQKRAMELTTNSIENENKLRELEAARIAVNTRREQQLAMMQRREGYMANKEGTEAGKAERERQQREKSLTDLGEMEARLVLALEKMKIEAMADGHAKRMAILDQERKETLNKVDELQRDFADKNKKAGNAAGDDGLTDKQREAITRYRQLAEAVYQKQAAESQKMETDESESKYKTLLEQYQTYEQKRAALVDEYAKKRAIAQAAGDTTLGGEIDRAERADLAKLAFEELKKSGDYTAAFDDLEAASTAVLQRLAEKFEEVKQSAGENLDPADLKQYLDAIKSISDEIARRNPFVALKESYKGLREAGEELHEAEAALNDIRKQGKQGTDEESKAVERVNTAAANYSKQQTKIAKMNKNARRQVGELCSALGDLGEAIGGEAGKVFTLMGDIGGLFSTLGEGITTVADKSLAAMSVLEKASFILTAISAAYKFASKIVTWFTGDGGKQALEDAQFAYKNYADTLRDVADAQLELMETQTGANAVAAAKRAEELLKKQAEAARALGVQYLNTGATAGAHSYGVRQYKGMTAGAWAEAQKFADAYGIDFAKTFEGRMDGIFNLTAEQLRKMMEEAPLFYSKLENETREYIEAIISAEDGIKEATDRLNDSLTATSFDNLRDEFKSALSDMENSTADFTNNFNKMLAESIAEGLMRSKYDEQVQALYDDWAGRAKDGSLDDTDLQELNRRKRDILEAMQEDRERIKQLVGNKEYSQSGATAGGFATASQDSVDELNGRFTAIQMDTAILRGLAEKVANDTANILTAVGANTLTMDEIKTISLLAINHLEAIQKNTSELYEMNERLGKIEKNTRTL